ncbi:MAG: hypothetical protein NXH85_12495 [Pseudomonadaceae bacterium]|nr:hypothetical protein [Pseudomonadaceae bacterium]
MRATTDLSSHGLGRVVTTILVSVFILSACSGPTLMFAGGELAGSEGSLHEATIPAEPVVIQLETRPSDPYSVNVGAVPINQSLYIDPAEERTWFQHIAVDDKVRIRLPGDETIYTAQAVRETSDEVLAQFEPDRIVLRLDPR